MKTRFMALLAATLLPAFAWSSSNAQETPPLASPPPSAASLKATVMADKLNVRVKPALGHSVVAVLNQGDTVELTAKSGDWLAIVAPPSSSVWIASSFLDGERVKKRVHLRSGPGVAYEPFGIIEPDDKVKILDSSKEHWTRIEAPPWLRAYISSSFVKAQDEAGLARLKDECLEPEEKDGPAQEAPSGNAAAPAGTKEEPPAPAATPAQPDGQPAPPSETLEPQPQAKPEAKLPFIEGYERDVSLEGMLLPLKPESSTYVTHALASEVNNEFHPICYLHSAKFNLKLWEGKNVRVGGTQRWVENWRRPVLEIEKITPAWR